MGNNDAKEQLAVAIQEYNELEAKYIRAVDTIAAIEYWLEDQDPNAPVYLDRLDYILGKYDEEEARHATGEVD